MRVLGSLLLTLIVLPCSAEPARHPQQLKSLSLEQLGNIKVTTFSKQPEEVWHTPAAIYVMTQADIRRSGAITLPELLRMIPGVQVSRIQSDQWAVGVRGFASQFSKGLLVLIDGRSVYTPLFEGVYSDVQDTMLADIDRVEVIRGPGGTAWGANAVNGRHFTIAANGRSLLQPHHREFTGDNGNAVGIRRRLYASLTWMS